MGRAIKSILPAVIVAGGIGVSLMMSGMKKPPEQKPQETKSLLVAVAPVIEADFNHKVRSQGTVKPLYNTELVSEVNGKIQALSDTFVAGGFFAKGDMLIRIDPADYRTAVKTAEANLAKAQASLQEEKARAKVAEVEWNAAMKGEAPDLYLRKPQLARELANVRSAEADLEKARRDLERTVIRAPYDGMVKKKAADIGQFVSRGTNLGSLYSTEVAEVRLPLSDEDLAFVDLPRAGATDHFPVVELFADSAGQKQRWQAKIVRSEGVVDEKSRVTYAVAQIEDPYGLKSDRPALPFGRFVSAEISGKHASHIVKLPRHLLTSDNQVLMLVDHKLDVRPVTVVRTDERYAYISAGMNDGEQYITSVIPNPLKGMSLRTAQDEETQSADESDSTAIATADGKL